MGRRTRFSWTIILLAGLVAVAAGCGTSGAGSAVGPKPCAAITGSQIRSAFGSEVGKGSPFTYPGERWCSSPGPPPANLAAEYARTPDKTPVSGIGQQAKWTSYSTPGFAGGRLTVLDHDYVLQIVISGAQVHPAHLEESTISLAREALAKLGAPES